jgi:nucleotide-binding universal stress UspA family protein
MFRHILIPTDGSPLSARGVLTGVNLARALGARVSGVHVMPPRPFAGYDENTPLYAGLTPGDWRKHHEQAAREALALVEREARAAKVPCSSGIVRDALAWKGILRFARSKKCDAIVLGSHGRGALGGLILGNETQHVLARSKIPVLVVR